MDQRAAFACHNGPFEELFSILIQIGFRPVYLFGREQYLRIVQELHHVSLVNSEVAVILLLVVMENFVPFWFGYLFGRFGPVNLGLSGTGLIVESKPVPKTG